MTQDERWLAKYNEIMTFMVENHRRPSKYYLEERNNWNWMRHQQKLMGKGEMKEERIGALHTMRRLRVRWVLLPVLCQPRNCHHVGCC